MRPKPRRKSHPKPACAQKKMTKKFPHAIVSLSTFPEKLSLFAQRKEKFPLFEKKKLDQLKNLNHPTATSKLRLREVAFCVALQGKE